MQPYARIEGLQEAVDGDAGDDVGLGLTKIPARGEPEKAKSLADRVRRQYVNDSAGKMLFYFSNF